MCQTVYPILGDKEAPVLYKEQAMLFNCDGSILPHNMSNNFSSWKNNWRGFLFDNISQSEISFSNNKMSLLFYFGIQTIRREISFPLIKVDKDKSRHNHGSHME